jgi:hypothetical protein
MRASLRKTALYALWRSYREHQQLRRFNQLLDQELGSGTSGEGYTEARLRTRLQAKSAQRRPWPAANRQPRVVAFGACDWEQFGLWPSFERMADFTLWEYRAPHEDAQRRDRQYRLDLARRFLAFLDEFEKEGAVTCVYFYASGEYIADELLEELARRGIWSIIMSLDDKHQFSSPLDPQTGEAHQLRVARLCDLYWSTWKTGAEIVSRKGGTPWYAPEAADPAFHHPVDVERDLDVVFVGQAYGARAELVRYLRRRGFSVEAFGAGWPGGYVSFETTVELFSRAKVVLGVGGVGHMSGVKHLKGRDFEVPMCGALYLTSFNPELADHFEVGREILCYASPEECADLLHWVLRHPEQAQRVREAALARSLRDHTWAVRLQALFSNLAALGERAGSQAGPEHLTAAAGSGAVPGCDRTVVVTDAYDA